MNSMVTMTQCPECAKRGKDNHHDNLAVYPNGAVYCFSCGYFQYNAIRYKPKLSGYTEHKEIILPWDITDNLPKIVLDYLNSFYLTKQNIKETNIFWSDYYQRVCFPVFSKDKHLLAWQGRYLGNDTRKPKWFSQGNLKDILHIIKPKHNSTLVLTEDIVSAIRVGSQENFCASPLFGSHIDIKKLYQYDFAIRPNQYLLWLDKDKEIESYKFTQNARQSGLPCVTIVTDRDPKTYTHTEIKRILKEYM